MINFNGNIIQNKKEIISFENRGLHYGDAVFETIRVSNRKVNFWEDHYFRLMASMRILRMDIPMAFSMDYLEKEIIKIIDVSQEPFNHFRIKLFVNRKAGGKYTPKTNDVDYYIIYEKLNSQFFFIDDRSYKVELFKDYLIPSNLLSTLKLNSKTINVLGSIYAKENNYDNCLLINDNKQVVEALNGNIFLVIGKTIITPPISDGCIRGILRKQIISLCSESITYTLKEESISPFDIQKADELFITNSIIGIQPVTRYRKKEFSTRVAKELLKMLNAKIN